MPGTDPAAAQAAAQQGYRGEAGLATAGLILDLA